MKKTRKKIHVKVKPKHVLSRLRKVIGVELRECEPYLGLSPHTVKSIQSGRLRFSERNAQIVSAKTAIAVDCLLENNDQKPLVCVLGCPYTRETYDSHELRIRKWEEAQRKINKASASPSQLDKIIFAYQHIRQFHSLTIKLARLLLAAHSKKDGGFVWGKLEQEMRRLGKSYPDYPMLDTFERKLQNAAGGNLLKDHALWTAITTTFISEVHRRQS